MDINDSLKYFGLDSSYQIADLDYAYKQKLRELNKHYKDLLAKVVPQDDKNLPPEFIDQYQEIVWKIILNEQISEENAKCLFTLLLDIKNKLNKGILDQSTLVYLTKLKYDGSIDDLELLSAIASNSISQERSPR